MATKEGKKPAIYNKALYIASRREGFRRCGIAHPTEMVMHSAGTFTEDQVEILKAEPMLIVSETGNAKAVENKQAELDEREAALDAREEELIAREEELERKSTGN